MSDIAIIYKSKYGATKKYAQWLSEQLKSDLYEVSKVTVESLLTYQTIVFCGGIYATGIAGLSFIKKNIGLIREKKIIILAVGASPNDPDSIKVVKERNMKESLENIPFFYARGAWNEEKMSFKDRTMCRLLKKAVSKKDPKEYQVWEKALMEAIGSSFDWTDKENLKPLLAYIKKT